MFHVQLPSVHASLLRVFLCGWRSWFPFTSTAPPRSSTAGLVHLLKESSGEGIWFFKIKAPLSPQIENSNISQCYQNSYTELRVPKFSDGKLHCKITFKPLKYLDTSKVMAVPAVRRCLPSKVQSPPGFWRLCRASPGLQIPQAPSLLPIGVPCILGHQRSKRGRSCLLLTIWTLVSFSDASLVGQDIANISLNEF